MPKSHKEIYCEFFGYTHGDTIFSELDGKVAVDVHAITGDQMGGRKEDRPIEELIALTREQHHKYGGRKQHKEMLYRCHIRNILRHKPDYQVREEYQQYVEK